MDLAEAHGVALAWLQRHERRRPGGVPKLEGCAEQASELLGWRANRSLVEMCRDGWAWQKANPQGYP